VVVAIIDYVLYAFVICIWIRAILSWFPTTPGGFTAGLGRAVTAVTDPVLRPVRRILPPMRAGGGALDLSPLLVSVVALVLIRVI
jgi:YggT family protein